MIAATEYHLARPFCSTECATLQWTLAFAKGRRLTRAGQGPAIPAVLQPFRLPLSSLAPSEWREWLATPGRVVRGAGGPRSSNFRFPQLPTSHCRLPSENPLHVCPKRNIIPAVPAPGLLAVVFSSQPLRQRGHLNTGQKPAGLNNCSANRVQEGIWHELAIYNFIADLSALSF